jgi:Phosphate acetyl/butaryl transferase
MIFPDLDTGDNLYKEVQRSTGGVAIGPVLQRPDKPVNDLFARRIGRRHRQHGGDHRHPGARKAITAPTAADTASQIL